MSQFTLIVVPPEWQFGMPLPINQSTYELWKHKLEAGTRVVFYDPAAESIVGEGEVVGGFVRPKEWQTTSADELPAWIQFADYALPVRTLYQRNLDSVIPLDEVRYILNDNSFPRAIGELREIDHPTYQQLTPAWL
ncbi:MAG TPA: hypothetical protein VK003_19670 [Oceanobacillus sp.]|nr:hypothetical protein [Oceanobacillus sp.]